MKPWTLSFAIPMMVLVSVVIGNEGSQETSKLDWGPEFSGCKVSLRSTQSAYHHDKPIHLKLAIKNNRSKLVLLVYSTLREMLRFEVLLPDGSKAPLTLQGKAELMGELDVISAYSEALEPGETTTEDYPSLNRIYDMTLPGEYTVTVYRTVSTGEPGEKPLEIKSNTIKISVDELLSKEGK